MFEATGSLVLNKFNVTSLKVSEPMSLLFGWLKSTLKRILPEWTKYGSFSSLSNAHGFRCKYAHRFSPPSNTQHFICSSPICCIVPPDGSNIITSNETCCTCQLTLILFNARDDTFPHSGAHTGFYSIFEKRQPAWKPNNDPRRIHRNENPHGPCHSTRPQKPRAVVTRRGTRVLCNKWTHPKDQSASGGSERPPLVSINGLRRDGQFKQMHFLLPLCK